jgi:serine phosphatase RsbU (regulator of sigma subunit)
MRKWLFIALLVPIQAWPQSNESELIASLKTAKADSSKARIYASLTEICAIPEIENYAHRGLELVERSLRKYPNDEKLVRTRMNLMANLAFFYGEILDTVRFDSLSSISIDLYKALNDHRGLSTVLNNIGHSHVTRGNYQLALKYYQESLSISESLGDYQSVALRFNNMGDVYGRLGMLDQAIEYLKKALEQYDKANYQYGQALVLSNLSNYLAMMGNIPEAERFSGRALALARKHQLDELKGTIYQNYGNVFQKKNQIDVALLYYDSSLAIKKIHNAPREVLSTMVSIAYVQSDLKNYPLAMAFYDSAQVIAEELNIPEQLASILMSRGRLKLSLNDQTGALEDLSRGYQLAKKAGLVRLLVGITEPLAQIYQQKGDYKLAYQYISEYSRYNDQFFSDRNKEMTLRKVMAYESNYQRSLDSLANAAEQMKAEAENQARLQEEKDKQQMLYYGLGAVGIIVILLVVAVANQRKSNALIRKQKLKSDKQRELIAEKNQEIIDSINYARRIQQGMLPDKSRFAAIFPDSFVFYLPKDRLSGDFYWSGEVITTTESDHLKIFSVADCTGHGVPGALVSILGIIYLKLGQSMPSVNSPAQALNLLNEGVHSIFDKDERGEVIRDGMDIALGAIRMRDLMLFYAAAKNPIYVVRESELHVLSGDSFAVGKGISETPQPFNDYSFQLQSGDMVYAFSDGFADQFGGEKGKKYKYARFKEFLVSIAHKPGSEQFELLSHEFDRWHVGYDQIDDVTVMGLRI